MISTSDISLYFGSRKLFSEVSLKFDAGNCYGIIGANGAGKSTFLKILSGEQEPSKGEVFMTPGQSMSVLKQDHFQYNEREVLETVMLGNERLMEVTKERDAIYAKEDMSEDDGIRAAELESEFAMLGGWEAETDAATLLNGLGLGESYLQQKMSSLKDDEKVKVLLAQALFGNPDNLLLDEPTNHLDQKAITWLENYLLDYPKTTIVISHDRHFLNKVCTHMVDIDFQQANMFVGNYDFWLQSSQLALQLRSNQNKRNEEKAKELEAFIRRFSANAAKSKQATSRKKQLEKLTIEQLPQSSRKHPYVVFQPEREAGDRLLEVQGLCKTINGQKVINNVSFQVLKGDKIIFVGSDEIAKTTLLELLAGKIQPDAGTIDWGVTTTRAYLPKDHNDFFAGKKISLIDWLREYSEDKSESFIRSFLGRMLFSGEETKKYANVLSGGEKVRCMLSYMMLQNANVLLLDGPTNHLDLESITSLNKALVEFQGTVLFTTHDQEFATTASNRIIEINEGGFTDHQMSYDQYIEYLVKQ